MADLFGPDLLPGLRLATHVISEAEEASLIAHVDGTDLSPFRFQGWVGRRLIASFGYHYDFEIGRLGDGEPMPPWIEPIRQRAAAMADMPAASFVQLLATRYGPGAGIGWHRDRSVFGTVAGLSLGARAVMRFRRRRSGGFDRFNLPLESRSIYILSGEAREDWEHSIAPMTLPRWSLTLRSLR